jgi:NADPH:quinone reductase-like Zn-dependent oxidoreductase
MKAIVCKKYGSPDVLQLEEVDKPTPKANAVLVKLAATTVNSGDSRIRGFIAPWFAWLPMRIALGFFGPRKTILGLSFAGEIEAVGKDVTEFRSGDQVFGSTGFAMGTYAEYACVPAQGVLAIKAPGVSYEDAAVIPFGGNTALVFLQRGNIQRGQKVLVYGASGAVGTAAIQLAKHFRADVTGVCSSTNLELVTSLGANRVIDYADEDFTESGDRYDLIFDAVGKLSKSKAKKALAAKGSYVTVNSLNIAKETSENMVTLMELTEAGKFRSVIERRYPLEQMAEAHRHVDAGHKKGAVVITL